MHWPLTPTGVKKKKCTQLTPLCRRLILLPYLESYFEETKYILVKFYQFSCIQESYYKNSIWKRVWIVYNCSPYYMPTFQPNLRLMRSLSNLFGLVYLFFLVHKLRILKLSCSLTFIRATSTMIQACSRWRQLHNLIIKKVDKQYQSFQDFKRLQCGHWYF